LELYLPLLDFFRAQFISIHSDACNCVLEVISGAVGTPIIDAFLSETNCLTLIGFMKENPSSIRYGLNVFIALLKYIGDIPIVDYLTDSGNEKPTPSSIADLPELIQVMIASLPYFIDHLRAPSTDTPPPTATTQNPTIIYSFGYIRLRLIQVITMLLNLNFSVVNNYIFDSDILTISMDLILAFPQNTFAHQAIEGLWAKTFEVAESESCVKILNKTSIIKRLIWAEEENTASEQAGKLRKPYMPYLHQLAFTVQSLAHSEVKHQLEQTEGWNEYIRIVELTSMPITERQRRGGSFRM